MVKQNIDSIKNEIVRLQLRQKLAERNNNLIESRFCYAMSELLRWVIENTTAWEKPTEQAIDNANILERELKRAEEMKHD